MLPFKALVGMPAAVRHAMEPFLRGSFSRYGEDLVLSELSASVRGFPEKGYFVDVGAHHPLRCSNTVGLYLLGWRGLNIDAHEQSVARIRQARPGDTTVFAGVAETPGPQSFHHIGIGAGSSFDPAHVERMKKLGKTVHKVVVVQCDTINGLLAAHLPPGQTIHYMDIDVEGLDEMVVRTLDTQRFRPWVISIETFTPRVRELIAHPATKELEGKGYVLMSVVGRTSFWVLEERLH